MENVILADSPLAEYLEGTRPCAMVQGTARANEPRARSWEGRRLPTPITHRRRRPPLCAARTLDAAREATRPPAAAAAHTRAQWLHCTHTQRVFGMTNGGGWTWEAQ